MTMKSGAMMPIASHARDMGRSLRKMDRTSEATTTTNTRTLIAKRTNTCQLDSGPMGNT